jgi:hypothetical protein
VHDDGKCEIWICTPVSLPTERPPASQGLRAGRCYVMNICTVDSILSDYIVNICQRQTSVRSKLTVNITEWGTVMWKLGAPTGPAEDALVLKPSTVCIDPQWVKWHRVSESHMETPSSNPERECRSNTLNKLCPITARSLPIHHNHPVKSVNSSGPQ